MVHLGAASARARAVTAGSVEDEVTDLHVGLCDACAGGVHGLGGAGGLDFVARGLADGVLDEAGAVKPSGC